MRKISILLASVAVIAVGLSMAPAQAYDGWRNQSPRAHQWQRHHSQQRHGYPGYHNSGYYGPRGY